MKKNEIITALFIANKNILRNWIALSFTVGIISLGFVSSVFMYGIMEDVKYDLEQNFIESNLGHIIIEPYNGVAKLKNTDFLMKKILTIPGILRVVKMDSIIGKICDFNLDCVDLEIIIVNPEDFADFSVVDNIIKYGYWLNEGSGGGMVIGCSNLMDCSGDLKGANKVDIDIGSKVNLSIKGEVFGDFYLQGVYDHYFKDVEMFAYISKYMAEDVFQNYSFSSVDTIALKLSGREDVERVHESLIDLNFNAEIFTWEEKLAERSEMVKSFSVIGDLSFLIGICISFISVLIILYIIILTKESQIGIIKAIGIKSNVISLSYIFLGFFLGVVGGILGVILTLALIFFFEIYPLITGIGKLVPMIELNVFIIVFVAIIFASVLSSYVVSRRISKQNIIEAVFNE